MNRLTVLFGAVGPSGMPDGYCRAAPQPGKCFRTLAAALFGQPRRATMASVAVVMIAIVIVMTIVVVVVAELVGHHRAAGTAQATADDGPGLAADLVADGRAGRAAQTAANGIFKCVVGQRGAARQGQAHAEQERRDLLSHKNIPYPVA